MTSTTRSPTQHLLRVLRAASFRASDEADLQRAMAKLLDESGISYQREKIIGMDKASRIDFWLPDPRGGIGLELKVGQPAKNIYRQLLRYADHGCISELVLASTSHTALRLPTEALGKPLHSIQLRAWC
ncbi:MAG TPA: hypothetical protein VK524_01370 [Polyangiaceae bacterium]|nr:hypothetical protein [Polyangiaceae bacterium]